MKFEDKKIIIRNLIFSFFTIIIFYLLKVPKEEYLEIYNKNQRRNIPIPLDFYEIDVFGVSISYSPLIISLITFFAINIYWLIYKNDNDIKNHLSKIKNTLFKKSESFLKNSYFKNKISQNSFFLKTVGFTFLCFFISLIFVNVPLSDSSIKSESLRSLYKSKHLLELYSKNEEDNTLGIVNGIENSNPFSEIQKQRVLNYILNSLNNKTDDAVQKKANETLAYEYIAHLVTLKDYREKLASFDAKRNYTVGAIFGTIFMIVILIILYKVLNTIFKGKYKSSFILIFVSLILIQLFYHYKNLESENELLKKLHINIETASFTDF